MRLPSLLVVVLIVAGGCAAPSVTSAPVGPLVVRGYRDGGGAVFLGSDSCGACHAAEYARWRATGHARDFAGLPPADRLNSACLRCHVTGYGDRSGYRTGSDSLDLGRVGCEACHGPGADHGRSAYPGLVPTLTGGECPPCEINRLCRLCHTPERSAGFDLARDLARTSCKP